MWRPCASAAARPWPSSSRTCEAAAMRTLAMRTIVFLGLGMAAVLGSGCGRVKCETYCDRVNACYTEILEAYGIRNVDADRVASWRTAYTGKCLEHCRLNRGYGKDAARLEKCLKATSCEAFAACLKRVHPRGW